MFILFIFNVLCEPASKILQGLEEKGLDGNGYVSDDTFEEYIEKFKPQFPKAKGNPVLEAEKEKNYTDMVPSFLMFVEEVKNCLEYLPLDEIEEIVSEEFIKRIIVEHGLYESCNISVNPKVNDKSLDLMMHQSEVLNQLGMAKNWIADNAILPGMKVFLSYVMCLNTEFIGDNNSTWNPGLLKKTERIVFKAIENIFEIIKREQPSLYDDSDTSVTYSPEDEKYLDKLFLKLCKELQNRGKLNSVLISGNFNSLGFDKKNNNDRNLSNKSLDDLRNSLDEKMMNLCKFYSDEGISINLNKTEFYSNIAVYQLTYGKIIKNIVVFIRKYEPEGYSEVNQFAGVSFDFYSSNIIVLKISEMFFLNGNDEQVLAHEFAHIIDVLKSGKGVSAEKNLLTEVPAIFAERISGQANFLEKRIDYIDFFKKLLVLNISSFGGTFFNELLEGNEQKNCASLLSLIKKVQSESIKTLDANLIKSKIFPKMQYTIGGLVVDYLTAQEGFKKREITLNDILNYIQEGSLENLLNSLDISIDQLTIFIANCLSILKTEK